MNKKILYGGIIFFVLFFVTNISIAADYIVEFGSPFGISTVENFFLTIIENLKNLVVLIAILFIVIGGLFYITAGESSERITTAKKIWTGSIIGLSLALLAPTFLREIQHTFLKDKILKTDINQLLSLSAIITNVLTFLLSIVGILAIISLVISGLTLIFSFGDTSKAEKAKEMIKWSLVGLALSGASVIIVRQIADFILTKP